jgi:hypothetical protein
MAMDGQVEHDDVDVERVIQGERGEEHGSRRASRVQSK